MNEDLTLQKVTLRFGGISALKDVSFTVRAGTIHAVVGPNGAGKSSLFNVISRVYNPTDGAVLLGDTNLTALPAHRLAGLGIARTFQNIVLAQGETVLENLMTGRHHLMNPGILAAMWASPAYRRKEQRHTARASEIAAFLGLEDHLGRPVGALPYGMQKRVEMARALSAEPRILMLDEPVAGMNAEETLEMEALIADLHRALDLTVLIVEHDMGMVMRLADRVSVLDFGVLVSDGTPEQVQADPIVINAYLGRAAASESRTEQE